MALPDLNHGALELILGMAGIAEVRASTDQPAAKLVLDFKQYGKPVHLELTMDQVIAYIGPARPPAAAQLDDPGPLIDIGLTK